jgi:hypothetical protein
METHRSTRPLSHRLLDRLGLFSIVGLPLLIAGQLSDVTILRWVGAGLTTLFFVIRLGTSVSTKHQRTEAEAVAAELGLRYEWDHGGVPHLPDELLPSPPGETFRDMRHTISGDWKGHRVWLFQGESFEQGDDEPSMVEYWCAATRVSINLPTLSIEPRNRLGRHDKRRPGAVDSIPEDPAISQRYVASGELSDIRQVLDGRVRAFLTGLPGPYGFRLGGPWVLAYTDRLAQSPARLLDALKEFVICLPVGAVLWAPE